MTSPTGHARRSLAVLLAGVAITFLAIPLILYSLFRQAHQDREDMLVRSLLEQGRMAAAAIAPWLGGADPATFADAAGALRRLSHFIESDAEVRLLFREESAGADFEVIAAAPPLATVGAAEREHRMLAIQGAAADVARSCAAGRSMVGSYPDPAGGPDTHISIVPIQAAAGCWAVLFSYPPAVPLGAALARPPWALPEVGRAAVLYLGLALVMLLVYLAVHRSLIQLGRVAASVSRGDGTAPSFREHNQIVELDEIAGELDHLVAALRRGGERLRQRSEDRAHALKTPIAVMRQSLVPLQRELGSGNERAQRALRAMAETVEKLDSLVDEARRLDGREPRDLPRRRVDLSRLLRGMMAGYGELAEGRGIELEADLPPGLAVAGNERLIASAIEAVLDEVIIASPPGHRVEIQLLRNSLRAEIAVAGEALPLSAEHRRRLFEARATDARPREFETPAEVSAGIGLRKARRQLEAMGGGIQVESTPGEGLLIFLDLPVVGAPPSGRQLRRRVVFGLQSSRRAASPA